MGWYSLALSVRRHVAAQGWTGMTWTTEKPTKPGWYWWRNNASEPRVVNIWQSRVHASILKASGLGEVLYCDGEWAGPLEPPT